MEFTKKDVLGTMAGHDHSRRHQMRIRIFRCFQMYPPSFSCSDTDDEGCCCSCCCCCCYWCQCLQTSLRPLRLLLLWYLRIFFYTSLRPFRLLLLWYLRMMSWIFGLCSKMLWHVSFASFTWIKKHFISWLRNIKSVFCLSNLVTNVCSGGCEKSRFEQFWSFL